MKRLLSPWKRKEKVFQRTCFNCSSRIPMCFQTCVAVWSAFINEMLGFFIQLIWKIVHFFSRFLFRWHRNKSWTCMVLCIFFSEVPGITLETWVTLISSRAWKESVRNDAGPFITIWARNGSAGGSGGWLDEMIAKSYEASWKVMKRFSEIKMYWIKKEGFLTLSVFGFLNMISLSVALI